MQTSSQAEFALGQRWLSESETELGLGVITQLDGRRIAVLFPATEEVRYYASHTAPLVRYQLQPEERGLHADGWAFVVESSTLEQGVLIYRVRPEQQPDQVKSVVETQLAHQVAAGQPLTRLMAGKTDHVDMYLLRRDAQQQLQRLQQSPASGLLGARVQWLPHQLYVANEVANRYQPRVLLADEVGLGKTIEAGLIMQRRILSGRAKRVLVVVPEALTHQWLVELQRRFFLSFSWFDEERCEQAVESGATSETVFDTEQLILISQDLLADPRWQPGLQASEWDLLIVDEAHHLTPETSAFATIKALCEHSFGLLLLTATPEQIGAEAHFERLRLLDPQRFADFEQFQQDQARYTQWAPLAQALHSDAALSESQREALASLTDIPLPSTPSRAERDAALNDLLDRFGTGRVMFRNTRQHVGGFAQRQLEVYPLDPLTNTADSATTSWWQTDPRVPWLLQQLKQLKPAKAVLICSSAMMAQDLAEALRVQAGIHAALFHEHMSLVERDRAAAFFASDEDGSPLLICSEIGSEGRNFQFVQHLILFDLPQHPDLLEQRIGRLDRIGQAAQITIHVPVCAGSDAAVLLPWYHEGMQAFAAPNACGHQLYHELQAELVAAFADPATQLAPLVDKTRQRAAEIRQQLAAGHDILQALSACRPAVAAQLLTQVQAAEQASALSDFLTRFCERFGVELEALSEAIYWLRPGDHMRVPSLAGLPDEGMQVSCDRQVAMAREDVALLSWDHPFIRGALELLSSESFGSTCLVTLNNHKLPAGAWFVEMYFRSDVTAPAKWVADDFYPPQRYRVLLDSQGRELTDKVPGSLFDQQGQVVEKKLARQLLQQLRHAVQQRLTDAWPLAERAQQDSVATAKQVVEQTLAQTRTRLQALAAKNPLVDSAEIAAVDAREQALLSALRQAQLSLDAVRIVVNAPQ